MKHALLSLLFISLAAQAAMVLPPESIQTDSGRRQFAKQILEEMPMLPSQGYDQAHVSGYVTRMSGLLYKNGLAEDQQFKQWAKARPDLKTYSFYSFHEETKDLYSLSTDYPAIALGFFEDELEAHYRRNKKGFVAYLATRISDLAAASSSLQSNAVSAGLGSLFDQNIRREILGQKNIVARSESLRAALQNVSEADLRTRFQSERFGIPRDELTVERALQLLDLSVEQELELIHLLSALEVLERSGDLSADAFSAQYLQWFTSEEAPEFMAFPDSNETVISTIGRVRAIAKNSFTTLEASVTRVVRDSEIIVQEVPPHLAVFRSCAGGDCSTSSSWAYPFSPMERNFYIFNPDNLFEEIGYISGNILQLQGKDTLYIRDMTGRNLAPEQIDLIIKGFAQILPETGVSQLAFAVPQFHSSENHFPPLYSRIEAMIKNLPVYPTKFYDAKIRENYLNPVVSSAHYDSPERHDTASLYVEEKIDPNSPPVRGERLSDTFIQDGRNQLPVGEGLLRRLELALASNNPAFLKGTAYKFTRWVNVYAIWMNRYPLKLDQYFEAVSEELKKIGFQLTPALQRKFPDLFFHGIIASPDAFVHPDEKVRHRNFDLVLQKFLRFPDANLLANLRTAKATFYEYPPFLKAAKQMLERFRPADRTRITALWNQGFFFENMPISKVVFEHLAQTSNAYDLKPAAALVALAYDHDYEGVIADPNVFFYALQVIGRQNNKRAPYYEIASNHSEIERKVAMYFATRILDQSNGYSGLYQAIRFRALAEKRPFFRVALTLSYLRGGKVPTKLQFTKFEQTLSENLDSEELSEELRLLARQALADLRQLACELAIAAAEKKAAGATPKGARAG